MSKDNPIVIKPTLGRKVWYTPHKTQQNIQRWDSSPVDATVVYVHGDNCINIAGWDHNGRHFSCASVPLVQDGQTKPQDGGYCEWMPFQKGQAKSQESAK